MLLLFVDMWATPTALTLALGLGAAANPWDKYNLSPRNRELRPVGAYRHSGASFAGDGLFPVTLNGTGAYIVLDFGQEVGGFTTLRFGDVAAGASVGLAYSESTNYAACPSDAVGSDCARHRRDRDIDQGA